MRRIVTVLVCLLCISVVCEAKSAREYSNGKKINMENIVKEQQKTIISSGNTRLFCVGNDLFLETYTTGANWKNSTGEDCTWYGLYNIGTLIDEKRIDEKRIDNK